MEERKKYLLNKYFKIDEFIPISTQRENLIWLYKEDLISKNELTEKLDLLKNSENN